jgi:hypothetical protein
MQMRGIVGEEIAAGYWVMTWVELRQEKVESDVFVGAGRW